MIDKKVPPPPPFKTPLPKLPPAATFKPPLKVPPLPPKPSAPVPQPKKAVEQPAMPKDCEIISYKADGPALKGHEAVAIILLPNDKRRSGFEPWEVNPFFGETPEEAESKARAYWNAKLDAIARRGEHYASLSDKRWKK
jgi:hypothetical protein